MSQHRKTNNNDEKEMTILNMRRHRQILLMALSFVFCWAPFGWIYLVKLIGIRDIDSRARSDMVPLLCVKLGSAVINPLIYVFENTKVITNCLLHLSPQLLLIETTNGLLLSLNKFGHCFLASSNR